MPRHRFGPFKGSGDAAGGGDVVVFNQERVVEAETVVDAPAAAYGVFLKGAEARRGLASVDDHRFQRADRVNVGAGERSDAAQSAQKVQSGALGAKEGPGVGVDLG
jgi:hypothetical protein